MLRVSQQTSTSDSDFRPSVVGYGAREKEERQEVQGLSGCGSSVCSQSASMALGFKMTGISCLSVLVRFAEKTCWSILVVQYLSQREGSRRKR